MSIKSKGDFEQITKDILENKEFKDLDKEMHHGISRYEHSINVAIVTYKISRFFNLNTNEATRAALLHDFFKNEDVKHYNSIKKYRFHPYLAYQNSKKYFEVTDKEKDAIMCHMFPWTLKLPSSGEGWIVTMADKIVAAKEWYNFKFTVTVTILILFLFNIITIQK